MLNFRVLVVLVCFLIMPVWAGQPQSPEASTEESLTVKRIDNTEFNVFIQRPESPGQWPILLLIDTGGCYGSQSKNGLGIFHTPAGLEGSVATVVVEKPAMAPEMPLRTECPKDYKHRYSIDTRVTDHLRALQVLRKSAGWWNGDLYIHGYSEGAAVGVQLAAYYPDVKRAAFGGLGGGLLLSEMLRTKIICHENVVDVKGCREYLDKKMEDIRLHPGSSELWGGPGFTYKYWASRMDNLEYLLLKDMNFPVLLYHGANDRDVMPVESARETSRILSKAAPPLTYWEIPQMQNALTLLPQQRRNKIWQAVNHWVMGQKPGAGGPPKFGL